MRVLLEGDPRRLTTWPYRAIRWDPFQRQSPHGPLPRTFVGVIRSR